MAEKPVSNHSSEGVVAIRHPRTDFPQDGWLDTVNLYADTTGFGWYPQTQATGRMARGHTYFSSAWVTVSKDTDAAAFDPAVQSWMLLADRMAGRRRYLRTSPDPTVWNAALQTFDPALQSWTQDAARLRQKSVYRYDLGQHGPFFLASSWTIPADRPAKVSRRRSPFDSGQDVSWSYSSLPVVFDPALQSWAIDSIRTPLRHARWVWSTPTYSVARVDLPQSWIIDSQLTRKPRARPHDGLDTGWVYNALPAQLDPAIQSWSIQTERTGSSRTYFSSSWVTVSKDVDQAAPAFDPAIQSWAIASDRSTSRNSYEYILRTIHPFWHTTQAPAFDPALVSWQIDSHRVTPRSYWTPNWRRTTTNYNVARVELPQPWTIETVCTPKRPQGLWQPSLDLSWITENIPAAPTTALRQRRICGNETTGADDWSISYQG